jgi:hypothetical protein
MSTLATSSEPGSQLQPHRGLWVVLGVLVAVQLVAFWLLCSQQVQKADTRHSEETAAQMALTDCLQYTPGATPATCASRLGIATAAADAAQPDSGANGAVPVSFNFR